jgi:hypothetical protein
VRNRLLLKLSLVLASSLDFELDRDDHTNSIQEEQRTH